MGKYCTQHGNKLAPTLAIAILPETRSAVATKIRKNISKRGEDPGFIYVYRLEGDEPKRFKVGMTVRSVRDRLKEWASEHKLRVIQVASWDVERGCKWLERMIHLYLDPYRLIRYEKDNGTFDDFWYSDNTPLVAGTEKGVAMHRHVEWFAIQFDIIETMIDKLIAI